jgi:hypothetical protein
MPPGFIIPTLCPEFVSAPSLYYLITRPFFGRAECEAGFAPSCRFPPRREGNPKCRFCPPPVGLIRVHWSGKNGTPRLESPLTPSLSPLLKGGEGEGSGGILSKGTGSAGIPPAKITRKARFPLPVPAGVRGDSKPAHSRTLAARLVCYHASYPICSSTTGIGETG